MTKKQQLSEKIVLFRTSKIFDYDNCGLTRGEASFILLIDKMQPVLAKNLSAYLNVSKVYTCKIVHTLKEKGYICISTSNEDKRRNPITVSEKGAILLEKYYKEFNKISDTIYDELGEEKVNQFIDLLDQANEIIKKYNSK